MYGWEFPPFISGGLGVACYAIVQELIKQGIDVNLVLPYSLSIKQKKSNLTVHPLNTNDFPLPNAVQIFRVEAGEHLNPYVNQQNYQADQVIDIQKIRHLITNLHLPAFIKQLVGEIYLDQQLSGNRGQYLGNLMVEVFRYAALAGKLATQITHDLIYAHDWLTVLAGLEAKFYSRAPLVLHIHALEIDRSEGIGNSKVYAIEKYGMEQADQVIAVSQYTKDRIIQYYGINSDKIKVVHNGVHRQISNQPVQRPQPTVLFVGRLTYQKGPYFFIEVAKRILAQLPNTQFVLAGTGDLYRSMVDRTAALKIGTNVHFTGFLNTKEVQQLYNLASVYVMPSISEPFGLTALEAAAQGIPVVVSKQSGVKEVLKGALVADFWDVNDLSNKIISLLSYPSLADDAVKSGFIDLQTATWEKSVQKIIEVYREVIK